MCLRSNYKIIYFEIILYCVVIVIILLLYMAYPPMDFKITLYPIILFCSLLLLIAYQIFSFWIAFGRTIKLTKEGCIVQFLCFSKLYQWNQMKTKRRIRITVGGRAMRSSYNGLLLSNKKVWFLETKVFYGLTFCVPTYHPFSHVFVLFEPNLVPRIKWPDWVPKWLKIGEEQDRGMHSGYFANEEQLLSLLHSWGVTLDDE